MLLARPGQNVQGNLLFKNSEPPIASDDLFYVLVRWFDVIS